MRDSWELGTAGQSTSSHISSEWRSRPSENQLSRNILLSRYMKVISPIHFLCKYESTVTLKNLGGYKVEMLTKNSELSPQYRSYA